MNIYISASWKQRERVRALAVLLRRHGHDVYDFTDPDCRNEPEIPPESYPEQFDPAVHKYREYLAANPRWRGAVFGNLRAILDAEAVVLLLPAGCDSHADWGVAVGLGKPTVVVGHPAAGERTPSHLWANSMLDHDYEVVEALKSLREQCPSIFSNVVREFNGGLG